jgi:hypothetical protein
MAMGSAEGAAQRHTRLCQASAEHFQQCTEFLPLGNRGLGRPRMKKARLQGPRWSREELARPFSAKLDAHPDFSAL